MGWVMPTLTILIGLGVFTVIAIIQIRQLGASRKIDVKENAPYIKLNSRRKFAKGYGFGIVKSQEECKNGVIRFEFFPMDYTQGENIKRPDMIPIVCNKNFVKRYASGELWNRELIELIDRFPHEMPDKQRQTPEGQEMAKEGQKAFLKEVFGTWTKEGDDALFEAIVEDSRVGLTKMSLAKLKELNREKLMTEPPQNKEKQKEQI